MESEPMFTPMGEFPLLEAHRRVEPAMLHHEEQLAQHTTNWTILAPMLAFTVVYFQWFSITALHHKLDDITV